MTEYARMSALVVGTPLVADDGFTCLTDGAVCPVQADTEGHFYVKCRAGKHYLDGQLMEDGDSLMGFVRQ